MSISCQLLSFGTYVPESVITNEDLTAMVDTSDQWIVERTGIRKRHRLGNAQNASTLGIEAAKASIKAAGIDPASITHVVTATCTPDHLSPSVACIIAGQLCPEPVMAFDIGAACTGFIYGLSICSSILAGEPDSRILFICAEALTRRLNWKDRSTCVLFGDAAVASVISGNPDGAICSLRDVICMSDGRQKDLITVGGGTSCQYQYGDPVGADFFLAMQGRDTYRHAVRQMVNVCETLLRRNNLGINDVNLLVPHQANMRIIEAVGSRLQIDGSRVFTNVANYGNTSAASIPLALAEARSQGLLRNGELVLVTAFGAGLTWGAALLDFHK